MSADAYTPAPARGSGPVYTRVYRPGGRLAHLRAEDGSGVLCPLGSRFRSWDDGWLGTGSQDEYERAASLPLCERCFARREARLPDPRLGSAHGREHAAGVNHARMSLTPSEREMRARVGAHSRWGRATATERTAHGQRGQAGLAARFEAEARARNPQATDAEIARQAKNLLAAHMARLALASAVARRKAREAADGQAPPPVDLADGSLT